MLLKIKKEFLIIVLILLIFPALQIKADNTDSKKFRIGALLSLTGACQDVGEMTRKGIELAIDEVNSKGGVLGKQLELVLLDTSETSSAKAVTAYKRMILNKDITTIIGPTCSPAGLAIAPLAAKNKNIVLTASSIGLRDFNKTGSNIFKLWPYDEAGPKVLVSYAIKKGFKKAAIFSSQQAWEQNQGNIIEEEFKRLGGNITIKIEALPGSTDLRSETIKIVRTKPDVIFLTNYLVYDTAAKELYKAGYKGAKFSTLITEKKIKLAQGALEDTIAYGYPRASVKFINLFRAKYKRNPTGISADEGYDIVKLYVKAIKESNSFKAKDIENSLLKIKNYPGASGKLSFDNIGGVLKVPILKIVKKGKLIKVN